MALLSIALTMTGFTGGIALGILAGYFMLIHFEPDDVKVRTTAIALPHLP